MGRCHPEVLSTDMWTSTDKGLEVRIELRRSFEDNIGCSSAELGRDLMRMRPRWKSGACSDVNWNQVRCLDNHWSDMYWN